MKNLFFKIMLFVCLATAPACLGSAGGTSDSTGDGGDLEALTEVEEDLLALINAERVAAGLPELVRDEGLDRIMLFYGMDMATFHHIGHIDANGRESTERARFYSGVDDVRCSEITEWQSGTPSGEVHYNGYKNSPDHHSAYMEEGIFNLGPTTHVGIIALSGTGPEGTSFEGRNGSYTGLMFCDQPLTLVIDPLEQ